jgi:hypothetical protein
VVVIDAWPKADENGSGTVMAFAPVRATVADGETKKSSQRIVRAPFAENGWRLPDARLWVGHVGMLAIHFIVLCSGCPSSLSH